MNRVYVLGTKHDLQKAERDPQENAAFKELIAETSKTLQIRAIVEEMSREALGKTDQSICLQVAHALALAHLYCDPDTQARKQLGIAVDDNELRIQAWYKNWPLEALARVIREEHAKREKIWLDEIRRLDVWPVLFVCGANHATPFAALLTEHDVECELIAVDWSPTASNQ